MADVGRALHHVPVGFYFRFSFLLFFFSLLSYSSRIPPRTSTEVGRVLVCRVWMIKIFDHHSSIFRSAVLYDIRVAFGWYMPLALIYLQNSQTNHKSLFSHRK